MSKVEKYRKKALTVRSLYWGGMAVGMIPVLLCVLIRMRFSEGEILGDVIFGITVLGWSTATVGLCLGLIWELQSLSENYKTP